MNNNPIISIVVPVYKTEKYLHRCVNSILTQTFRDFEIILIDDGSPDNSSKICDNYSKKDNRVKVYHKENGGVTSARKLGVEKAKGEWITFVDSDDTIPNNALLNYLDYINSEYDIIIGRMDYKEYPFDFLEDYEYRSDSITGILTPAAPWGKLIRRKLFDDFTLNIPREIKKGEDMLMNIRLAFNNKNKVRLINKCVYNYKINEEGCINTFNSTIEYEVLYNNYRILSIPERDRESFKYECLLSRLNGINLLICKNKSTNCIKHPYCIDLLKRINKDFPLILRYKLYIRNTHLLKVVLLVEKVLKKILRNTINSKWKK